VALSEGQQNALATCGGMPKALHTDRLSTARRNRDGSYALDITSRYQALCAHYGLSLSWKTVVWPMRTALSRTRRAM
jgi:hypothetical protein